MRSSIRPLRRSVVGSIEFRGRDLAGSTIQRDDEILGTKVSNRTSVLVDDPDVHAYQVYAGPERRLLDGGDHGGGENEDRIGWNATAAFVIDGATGLDAPVVAPPSSDAAWIAEWARERLTAGLAPDRSLRDVVRDLCAAADRPSDVGLTLPRGRQTENARQIVARFEFSVEEATRYVRHPVSVRVAKSPAHGSEPVQLAVDAVADNGRGTIRPLLEIEPLKIGLDAYDPTLHLHVIADLPATGEGG